MVSFYDLPIGKDIEFKRILADAGLSVDMVNRLIKNPSLAEKMVAVLAQPQSPGSFVQQVVRQLDCWGRIGVAVYHEARERILEQAKNFVPATDTDTPLVSGGFDYTLPSSLVRLWEAYEASAGNIEELRYKSGQALLQYAPGMKPSGSLRLIHFDPNAYHGVSPIDALAQAKKDGVRLAGIEVLEKLILDPDWDKSWDGKSSFYPILSGLQTMYSWYSSGWSDVPFLVRWGGLSRVEFHDCLAGHSEDGWASPVVREC